MCACEPEGPATYLADIQGRWTTSDDPRYTDRAFEIDSDYLYLLQGGDTFAVHKIHDVRVADDDLPEYTIEYRGDEGALFVFRMYLSQEDGGTLFFPNEMDMRWHRDPDAPVPWGALLEAERAARPAS
jgi:hypothetical protein